MVAWNENCQVVRDDRSPAGLRRLHLLRAKDRVDREPLLEWVQSQGEVQAVIEYEDDVGLHHLRVYWREKDD